MAVSGFVSILMTVATLKLTLQLAQFSTPDSDDTSKAIMALICLGGGPSVRSLIQTFESENHFMTYAGESNLSISSNCNILACLCMLEDRLPYVAQISKAAKFLCFQVTAGKARDKLVSSNSCLTKRQVQQRPTDFLVIFSTATSSTG